MSDNLQNVERGVESHSSLSTGVPATLSSEAFLCLSDCLVVRRKACLAAGVIPEGSQTLCARPQAKAIAGSAASSSNGTNKERTKHTIRAALAIEDRRNGRILLDSSTIAHDLGLM